MAYSASNLLVLAATLITITAPLQLCSAHPVVPDVTSQDQARSSSISGLSCTSSPLGMTSGAIPDSSLTASGSHVSYPPSNARLNGTGWWVCPFGKREGQWIQVDLGQYTAITGVIVQGYPGGYYIRTFAVNSSNTGESNDWQKLTDRGQTVQLNGHSGSGPPLNVTFPVVLMARFLRILPLTWTSQDHYYLRFEVLGCRVTSGMIRLVGGDDKWSGQVEIYRHDAWGAVCDSSWDMKDATTVCHQLGFIEALEAKTGLSSRESDRPIVMNRVACTGTERRLADCPFVCTGSQQCSSSTVAGVVCKPRPDELRLVGGSRTSGRVEIYRGGSWGTICDTTWNQTDAGIVCRQLGFSGALEAKSAAHFGQGSGPVHMDGVACEGSEEKISDCPSHCWEETSCSHSHDAGVICSDENTVTTNK
ncbi:soluble scavenger receptor cysteine-rich domain-containing protein SSC5D-like isoform X1 [Patiria miniata]|uniref:Uncharacterized protein n=1 Tax=Patiria miniata TaxID=46514 RepID=A0A914B085_PATMI|nr:soluble scavenger receptor cysteine-rich domain-containing protein SSC5D-like isoform X1 [Patiria miniata]